MITTNSILDTGVRGLRAYQIALSVTSHNVTNASTDGYTRQRAEMTTTLPLPHAPGMIGTGVEVVSVERMRMSTLDQIVRTETSQLGRWDQNASANGVLETMFGDPTDGAIGHALTEFWNSWQDLTTAPGDQGARSVVLQRALSLVDTIRDASTRLDRTNTGQNQTLNGYINDANSYISGIALLNQEISRAELGGQKANDLRDRRDLLIEKLSDLTDLTAVEQPNGMVDIDVGGQSLVSGITSTPLTGVLNPATDHLEVQIGGLPLAFTSGRFQGFVETFANIDSTRAALNTLASNIVTEVNAIHSVGYDLTDSTGVNFFTNSGVPGQEAATIDLDAAVKGNPSKIAASSSGPPTPVGNSANALTLALLRDKKVIGGATLNEAFGNLVLDLGSKSRESIQRREDYSSAVQAVSEQRDAISGVNMDEEISNMLNFQRAYEAASRVITTVDEMMDRIINHTGRVGA